MIRWSASVVAHFKVAAVCTLPSASAVCVSASLRHLHHPSAACGAAAGASVPRLRSSKPSSRSASLVLTHSGARPRALRVCPLALTPRHHPPPAANVSTALRPLIRAWYSTGGNCRPGSGFLPRSSLVLLLFPFSLPPSSLLPPIPLPLPLYRSPQARPTTNPPAFRAAHLDFLYPLPTATCGSRLLGSPGRSYYPLRPPTLKTLELSPTLVWL